MKSVVDAWNDSASQARETKLIADELREVMGETEEDQ